MTTSAGLFQSKEEKIVERYLNSKEGHAAILKAKKEGKSKKELLKMRSAVQRLPQIGSANLLEDVLTGLIAEQFAGEDLERSLSELGPPLVVKETSVVHRGVWASHGPDMCCPIFAPE